MPRTCRFAVDVLDSAIDMHSFVQGYRTCGRIRSVEHNAGQAWEGVRVNGTGQAIPVHSNAVASREESVRIWFISHATLLTGEAACTISSKPVCNGMSQ